MARPREQGINTAARSLRQLRRFYHLINADKIFGTHRASDGPVASIFAQDLYPAGDLPTHTSRGTQIVFGDGTGKPVAVRFTTRAAEWGILLDPELRLGEAYMDGSFVVEQGSIADVLAVVLGQDRTGIPKWAKPQWYLRYFYRRLQQFNPRRRSKRNVAHHYDLDGRLYSLFLDADRQYSCAYFEHPGQSLDDAQLAEKRPCGQKIKTAGKTRGYP